MKNKTVSLTLTGLFVAFLCIIAPMPLGINILGIPATFATFAMSLSGFILGAKNGAKCIFIYLFIGFLGIPVFSNYQSGAGIIFGPTGGFLLGFIPFAFFCGINTENKILKLLYPFLGLIICHIMGIIQFCIITKNSFFEAFVVASLPFLVKDILLTVFSHLISIPVKKALKSSKIKL